MGKPFIVGVLFMLVAIYLILVVFGWGATAAFAIAFPLGLAIMGGVYVLLNKFDYVPFIQSNWFIVILCVLVLVPLVWNAYLDLRFGYVEGDYSDHECSVCGYPADGGIFLSGREVKNYYCAGDFEKIKAIAERIDGDPSESEMWSEAKMIVESKLKSPSTAEFCSKSEASISQKGSTWTIRGYVDAENSFGTKLRNKFVVIITFTDDTHYTIEKCDIYT